MFQRCSTAKVLILMVTNQTDKKCQTIQKQHQDVNVKIQTLHPLANHTEQFQINWPIILM